jgi:hypothetical protein
MELRYPPLFHLPLGSHMRSIEQQKSMTRGAVLFSKTLAQVAFRCLVIIAAHNSHFFFWRFLIRV